MISGAAGNLVVRRERGSGREIVDLTSRSQVCYRIYYRSCFLPARYVDDRIGTLWRLLLICKFVNGFETKRSIWCHLQGTTRFCGEYQQKLGCCTTTSKVTMYEFGRYFHSGIRRWYLWRSHCGGALHRRADGTEYTKNVPVFVGSRRLINLLEEIDSVIDPEAPDVIIIAIGNYHNLCLDSSFTANKKNHQIPCGRQISAVEDRGGPRYCGTGFADERFSLTRPLICPVCEYKIRKHCKEDLEIQGRNSESALKEIHEDLLWIYENCVEVGQLHLRPPRLLELLRQLKLCIRTTLFEEIDRNTD